MDGSLSSDNKFISRLNSSLVDDMTTITDTVFTTYYCMETGSRKELKKKSYNGEVKFKLRLEMFLC